MSLTAISTCLFSTSRDGDSTILLESLFQCLTILSVKQDHHAFIPFAMRTPLSSPPPPCPFPLGCSHQGGGSDTGTGSGSPGHHCQGEHHQVSQLLPVRMIPDHVLPMRRLIWFSLYPVTGFQETLCVLETFTLLNFIPAEQVQKLTGGGMGRENDD